MEKWVRVVAKKSNDNIFSDLTYGGRGIHYVRISDIVTVDDVLDPSCLPADFQTELTKIIGHFERVVIVRTDTGRYVTHKDDNDKLFKNDPPSEIQVQLKRIADAFEYSGELQICREDFESGGRKRMKN
jgi:hypothetical protein